MATYTFDNITATQASTFSDDDRLIFLTGSASDVTVTYNTANSLSNDSITLTFGGKSVIFPVTGLSDASQLGNLIFVSGDGLVLGDGTAETIAASASLVGEDATVNLYGGAGNDTLNAGESNDVIFGGAGNDVIDGSVDASITQSDYLQGGAGADSIVGGLGNDHIYGNVAVGAAGTLDGADTINAGAGNDYVNGNAGADSINGGDGNDRLFGGADNDTIIGGAGNDSVNGNLGADSITGDAGNDTLRGGAGNDIIDGGADNDQLFGDLGNDTLTGAAGNDRLEGGDGADSLDGGLGNDVLLGGAGNDSILGDAGSDTITGGAGFDSLTGGADNDVFVFTVAGDASTANLGATGSGLTDEIVGFTVGADKIQLAADPTAIILQNSGTTYTTVQAAFTAAQSAMDATAANDAAVFNVGSDSYLFANTAGTANSIDTVIKLTGVVANTVTNAEIVG